MDLGLLATLNHRHNLLSFGERSQIYHRLIRGLGSRPSDDCELFSFEPILALLLNAYNQDSPKASFLKISSVSINIWDKFLKDILKNNPRIVSQKEWFGVMKCFKRFGGRHYSYPAVDIVSSLIIVMANEHFKDKDCLRMAPLIRRNFLFAFRAAFVLSNNSLCRHGMFLAILSRFSMGKLESSRPFLRKVLSLNKCKVEDVAVPPSNLSLPSWRHFLLSEYTRIKELPMRYATRHLKNKPMYPKL